RMQKASSRIAKGNYLERLDASGPGEVAKLAESFNAMAESLEDSEIQRRELIRNLAHEFRTPLSNLKGYLEGLEDGLFDADDEIFTASKQQIDRLERLLNDLALISRVEAKQEQINIKAVKLAEVFKNIEKSLQPSFNAKNIQLDVEIDDSWQVQADPDRLEQILINLLNNALRHSAANTTVKLWATNNPANYSTIHVKDQGEGIAKKELKHIFTRFYQVDSARSSGASGIGLTIAKHFVEAQGGQIFVDSELGKGSHFYFTLATKK
ncbi:MAG TPA: HAMP domain-containing histidine kinase, partial [Trueperaceae bacterium]|nr:HAMP domain-containing histidine kinase [Trueperaceae bacterium]